jgi:DNA polymerase-3 subunit alpha
MLRDKELTVAGMVTQVRHGTTKNGRPYGSFTIEDYTDSYNTALFGKDYENYRKFLYEGYSLLLKGVVQENSWKKPAELEFRIKSMHMLSSVRDELIHNIQIRIPLDRLTDGLLTDMKGFIEKRKGDADMRFMVYDPDEQVSVEMFSRFRKISLTDELLQYLSGNPDLEFKLY